MSAGYIHILTGEIGKVKLTKLLRNCDLFVNLPNGGGKMRKKAALHNLGCKVNAYETEAMRQLLEEAGYEIVPFAAGSRCLCN